MKDSTLIYTNYHRPIPLYNECVDRLRDEGWHLHIEDTSNKNYDEAMVYAQDVIRGINPDYIVFLDNDCFLENGSYLQELLVEAKEYDFVSYFEGWDGGEDRMKQLGFKNKLIEPILNQEFIECAGYPFFKPRPHYENALMILRGEFYLSLPKEALGHGRLWIKEMWSRNARFGVHQTSYKSHTHYGPGWFHMGALMSWYYKVEKNHIPVTDDPYILARIEFLRHQIMKIREDKNLHLQELTRDTWLEDYF